MMFQLIKNMNAIHSFYGNVPSPDNPYGNDEVSETYFLEDDLFPAFDSDFIDQINMYCDVLLDYGDVDYFDAKKCVLLSKWLQARLKKPLDDSLKVTYEKLDEFARRAIKLGTGVVVEL